MSLQEKVCDDGTKEANKTSEIADSEDTENMDTAEEVKADLYVNLVDLDNYLDTIMLDMTMSIAKA